jgi:hypothetical protein
LQPVGAGPPPESSALRGLPEVEEEEEVEEKVGVSRKVDDKYSEYMS